MAMKRRPIKRSIHIQARRSTRGRDICGLKWRECKTTLDDSPFGWWRSVLFALSAYRQAGLRVVSVGATSVWRYGFSLCVYIGAAGIR